MHSIFKVFAAAVGAATMVMAAASARAAGEVQLSAPVVHDNLAVYFVRGSGSGGAAPLTLEQAQAQGAIKIHETDTHPVMIENVSNQSVFIQLGDLIKGGMQDQVAGTSLLLPPNSGLSPLATFCVDPFRSSARDGDDPKLFSATGALFPSRMAKLSILSGASDEVGFRKVREQGVWWSIDSMRAQLSQKLGETLETPKPAHWSLRDDSRANVLLAARRSGWTTSLPLAMESDRLAQAQQPLVDGFRRAVTRGGDVVGAIFAIDGKIVGGDIYQSHALFRAMWPKLLRAYATEALATGSTDVATPPALQDVRAFIAAADQAPSREQAGSSQVQLRDGDAAIYIETAGRNGEWTHRSYVAKLDPAAPPAAPEALLVRMLETGQVDGRSLASLSQQDNIILQRNADSDGWSTAIQSPPNATARVLDLLQGREQQALTAGEAFDLISKMVSLVALWFLLLAFWRIVIKPVIRKGVALVASSCRSLARVARELVAATTAHASKIAQHCGTAWAALRRAVLPSVVQSVQRAYAPVRRMPRLRVATTS